MCDQSLKGIKTCDFWGQTDQIEFASKRRVYELLILSNCILSVDKLKSISICD